MYLYNSLLFIYLCYGYLRDLHSFPTRRSSDLGVRPALEFPNATLIRNAQALRLETNPTGTSVTSVVAEVEGELEVLDRKSTRLNSSHVRISYAVFCLKKKKKKII